MRNKIAPLVFTIVVVLSLYFAGRAIDPAIIKGWVDRAGVFGPLLIIAIAVITSVVAPLSGTPTALVGFALYGPKVVFLLTMGALVSAAINFKISKRWGRPVVKKMVGKENMTTIDKFIKDYGLVTLLFIRMFLVSVQDFVSYAMGLTNISFWPYMAITVVGAIPGMFIWYFLGTRTHDPLVFAIVSVVMTFVFSGIFVLGKIAFNKKGS